MPKVYTLGYAQPGASERLAELMSEPNTLLIDTRMSPRTSYAPWDGEALKSKWQGRYKWAGRYLGNQNFKGGPIKIANPETGIRGLQMYLSEGHSIVLLCGCKTYSECHRHVIVELLHNAVPSVEIVAETTVESIKCISVQQPWAHLLVRGFKDVENREWSTNYRGPLLIHAGKKIDDDWFYGDGRLNMQLAQRLQVDGVMPFSKHEYPTGSIVGQVELIDVVEESDSRWFFGRYGFVIDNVRSFSPIPYRGALKLFDVPKSALEAVLVK